MKKCTKMVVKCNIQIIKFIGGTLQMANNNINGFLDLTSKIVFLIHLYQSFNKHENKHLR
jgi:hypothetical protein